MAHVFKREADRARIRKAFEFINAAKTDRRNYNPARPTELRLVVQIRIREFLTALRSRKMKNVDKAIEELHDKLQY